MKQWIWRLAERADWVEARPRWFWRWLLRTMDRAHGHTTLDYND